MSLRVLDLSFGQRSACCDKRTKSIKQLCWLARIPTYPTWAGMGMLYLVASVSKAMVRNAESLACRKSSRHVDLNPSGWLSRRSRPRNVMS